MDKLELFNSLITVVTPVNSMGAKAEALSDPLSETGLDSLDLLMMAIYLSDIYGVSEEIAKTMQPITVNDMFVFMEEHATKTPTNLQEALESVK
jgi:acyl carrier protein